MNELETLVQPLELCRQIPNGKFADSALVYGRLWTNPMRDARYYLSDEYFVFPRCDAGIWYPQDGEYEFDNFTYALAEMIPAPTLAEIMSALPKCVEYRWFDDGFYPSHPKHYAGDFADPNPTTAVLKLWLTLNAGGLKK